jgi:regulatory protein RepA
MSGWRVDATLREFPPRGAFHVWFDYPIHRQDSQDLLKDAKADGEEAPWEAKQRASRAAKESAKEAAEVALEKAIEVCGGAGRATTQQVAETLGVTSKTVKSRVDKHGEYKTHRGVIIVNDEDGAE